VDQGGGLGILWGPLFPLQPETNEVTRREQLKHLHNRRPANHLTDALLSGRAFLQDFNE
jgi:hypothetical protein